MDSQSPVEVIRTWKAEFQRFWPERNWFYAPLEGIAPGEVALLNLGLPGRMKLSTGVLVLYADDESFTLMTPEGHMRLGPVGAGRRADRAALAVNAALVVRAWEGALALLSLVFITVGAYLGGRRPGNAVGWLLLGSGVVRLHGGDGGGGGVRRHHPLALGAGYLFPLFGLIPVAVAIAVFKYRLYEVDRLISRTLVYALLTALLVGVYAGQPFLLGRLLDPATGDSALAVAASTLAVAALFQPASASLWLRRR